jgi:hypothetical protein
MRAPDLHQAAMVAPEVVLECGLWGAWLTCNFQAAANSSLLFGCTLHCNGLQQVVQRGSIFGVSHPATAGVLRVWQVG